MELDIVFDGTGFEHRESAGHRWIWERRCALGRAVIMQTANRWGGWTGYWTPNRGPGQQGLWMYTSPDDPKGFSGRVTIHGSPAWVIEVLDEIQGVT